MRLLALNARRSAEEERGSVQWLRPSLQAAGGEQTSITDERLGEADDGGGSSFNVEAERRPWPTGLPEQIKAVAEVLSNSNRALSIDDLAGRFITRGRWRDRLPVIVETLEAIGRGRRVDTGGEPAWIGA